jgi:hypothetical protein
MRGRRVASVLVLVAAAAVAAEGTGPNGDERAARCRAACAPVVTRCVENLRNAFGDMRTHCERITLQKCLRDGPAECEEAAPGLQPPSPAPAPD